MAYTREQAETDQVKILEMAEKEQEAGNDVLAGIYRVEAENCIDRVGMKRVHCNNLGPYTSSNIRHCINCMKQGVEWVDGEECIPPAL